MIKINLHTAHSSLLILLMIGFSSCYQEDELNIPVNTTQDTNMTALDQYIDDNFTKEYGMAIRYRFVDNYVDPNTRVTPPRLSVVRPMLDFIEEFWIGPYLDVKNGEEYFRDHVPAELILLGGFIYNQDGTVTLGTADAGARITFTYVNAIDRNDEDWVLLQLQTVYHEFAHIVHQRYKLPPAFETISPQGYTSAGSWFTLTDDDALERGFVTPYATSSPNEDFAETVAVYFFDKDFNANYIDIEPDCTTPECVSKNEGRVLIQEKLNAISEHYEKVTGVNLKAIRKAVQSRLN